MTRMRSRRSTKSSIESSLARRGRGLRASALAATLCAAALAANGGACSGATPDGLTGPGGDAGADSTTLDGGACTTVNVQRQILAPNCAVAGCHTGADPAGSLDLGADGLEARLVGLAASECGGQTLVVAGSPDTSYLFHKVNDATPPCGERMPLGRTPLRASEISCIRTWIAALGSSGDGGGVGDGGDAGTLACQPGLTGCGTTCVDTTTDKNHCGNCTTSCPVACASGGCVTTCPGTTNNCSGSCVNLATDNLHCGNCTTPCPTGKVCTASACGCGAAVTFAAQVQPILTASCTNQGCHTGPLPKASMALTTGKAYAALVNAASATCTGRVRVTPGAVDQSYLWNKLTGVGMCAGTQMPKTGGALPTAQLDIIRRWICNGAPNN